MSKSVELLKRFESLHCAPDIIYRIGKLDLKELTECYAMVLFMKRFDIWNKKDLLVLDVGCGKRPTLGIMLAHLRKWMVVSIDPAVEHKKEHFFTERFGTFKGKLESVLWAVESSLKNEAVDAKEIIVCGNHSHHQFSEVENLTQYTAVHYFVNPCCIDNLPKNIKGECYINTKIWSEKNRLYYFYLPKKS
jgi:hypothetical protein